MHITGYRAYQPSRPLLMPTASSAHAGDSEGFRNAFGDTRGRPPVTELYVVFERLLFEPERDAVTEAVREHNAAPELMLNWPDNQGATFELDGEMSEDAQAALEQVIIAAAGVHCFLLIRSAEA